MKILIIGATHGNELLGTKLYARLLQKRSSLLEHVDFMIGNPKAFALKKRYIDEDLNRSYGSQGDSHEATRTAEIQRYVEFAKPDLIIDMHTTTCDQPNCLITNNLDGDAKQRFLRACHIDNILQIKPLGDVTTLGNNVIAYEVPNRSITPALLDAIIGDLERFVDDDRSYANKKLFIMSDKIYKKDVTPQDTTTFVNFELNPLGFVPIMTGNNSYKRQTNYLGFRSDEAKDIVVWW